MFFAYYVLVWESDLWLTPVLEEPGGYTKVGLQEKTGPKTDHSLETENG